MSTDLTPPGIITPLLDTLDRLRDLRRRYQRDFDSLTDKEVEVLRLVGSGLANPAIADTLGISRTTVQNHRARIRLKLNVKTEADYYRLALAFGLIEI